MPKPVHREIDDAILILLRKYYRIISRSRQAKESRKEFMDVHCYQLIGRRQNKGSNEPILNATRMQKEAVLHKQVLLWLITSTLD